MQAADLFLCIHCFYGTQIVLLISCSVHLESCVFSDKPLEPISVVSLLAMINDPARGLVLQLVSLG